VVRIAGCKGDVDAGDLADLGIWGGGAGGPRGPVGLALQGVGARRGVSIKTAVGAGGSAVRRGTVDVRLLDGEAVVVKIAVEFVGLALERAVRVAGCLRR